jgi:hypothetical protein
MNTGNALYAMPLFSIIDLGVNLKIGLAALLSGCQELNNGLGPCR